MSWKDRLEGDSLSWLETSAIPEIRYMAGRDLLELPDSDSRQKDAKKEAYINGNTGLILSKMTGDGYWQKAGPGYGPKYKSSVWSITLLGQLGADVKDDPRVELACNYMLDHSLAKHGQMTYNGQPSGTFDCLQGNLCWAILKMGCTDPRLDLAFDWMARSETGEGIAPATNKQADCRYYAYKCSPNFACGANGKLPCAWGAAKIMLALSILPKEKRTPMIQKAIEMGVDLFFSVDPATADYPRDTAGKPSRDWWQFGFPVFYITDLLQIADALTALGYGKDPRLQSTLDLILQKQDDQGRWNLEYRYGPKTWGDYGRGGKPNEWVTLRALRVLKQAAAVQ